MKESNLTPDQLLAFLGGDPPAPPWLRFGRVPDRPAPACDPHLRVVLLEALESLTPRERYVAEATMSGTRWRDIPESTRFISKTLSKLRKALS